jgi:hypothetical protein
VGSGQTLDGAECACPIKPPAQAHRDTINGVEAAASSHAPSPAIRKKGRIHRYVVSGMRPHESGCHVPVGRRCRRGNVGIRAVVTALAISAR